MNHMIKKDYMKPDAKVIFLAPSQSVLTGSISQRDLIEDDTYDNILLYEPSFTSIL